MAPDPGSVRRRGQSQRPEVYRAVLSAMRAEYAGRRGLLLRVKPWETKRSRAGLVDYRLRAVRRRFYGLV